MASYVFRPIKTGQKLADRPGVWRFRTYQPAKGRIPGYVEAHVAIAVNIVKDLGNETQPAIKDHRVKSSHDGVVIKVVYKLEGEIVRKGDDHIRGERYRSIRRCDS